MSAVDPKDPKFTLRLGRALFHLARGRSISAVAALTGEPRADIELWLTTFNAGKPSLTTERIEEVKRQIGVLVVRRVTTAERVEAGQRKQARQADDAQIGADKARCEAILIERRTTEKTVRAEKRAARIAKPVTSKAEPVKQQPPSPVEKVTTNAESDPFSVPHLSPITKRLPWRRIGPGWILKTVETWRIQLQAVASGTPADSLLTMLSRRVLVGFCTMRLRYFGPPENLTQATAQDLLNFAESMAVARGEFTGVKSIPVAGHPLVLALQKAERALIELQHAIEAARRAA